ncbi:MAG: HAD-IB family hydrolase [Chitinophagales bacterium]
MSDCKKIAFFDFDGTITTKDTLLEVIQFQKGKYSFYRGFLWHAPWLIAYKLKLISNELVKQKILKYFFGGMEESVFQNACDGFAEAKLPTLIRAGALNEIRKLKAAGVEVVIVSASAGNWIRKWSDTLSLELVSTSLEIVNGRITGRLKGKNCHGAEKVRRIRERWNLNEFGEVYAYGDTQGDQPMLSLATKSYYKPFRNV